MSKLAHSHPRGLLVDCMRCERLVYEADCDALASELCEANICRDCAPEVIEENGQFGVGA